MEKNIKSIENDMSPRFGHTITLGMLDNFKLNSSEIKGCSFWWSYRIRRKICD
jgi:hypothetical protein